MPKSDTATMIELAACGGQFLKIMQYYQECQRDNPNFDPRQALHDLCTDLNYLCNKTKLNLSEQ